MIEISFSKILLLAAGQAEAAAKVVAAAFEKNVYIGVITLETIALVALFTLLIRSFSAAKKELANAHIDHAAAMKQRSVDVSLEFKEKDEKLMGVVVKMMEVAKDVTNSVDNSTKMVEDLKDMIKSLG